MQSVDLTQREADFLCSFSSTEPMIADFDEVQCLTRYHLLTIASVDGDSYSWLLSHDGELLKERYVSEQKRLDEVANQKAEDKAEKSFNRKLNVFSAVASFVTFLAGLLVEHYAEVIGFIFGLF